MLKTDGKNDDTEHAQRIRQYCFCVMFALGIFSHTKKLKGTNMFVNEDCATAEARAVALHACEREVK